MAMIRLLDEMLGTRAKVAILRVLSASKQGYSARETCRRAGIAFSAGMRALDELVASGIVAASQGGGVEYRYVLNRQHYLAEMTIIPMFEAEASTLDALIADLAMHLRGTDATVVLYGSVSRAEDGPGSDLDLLVVGEPPSAERALEILSGIAVDFRARYGRQLSPLAMTPEGFASSGSFRAEVERDGLLVCGLPLGARGR